MKSSEVSWSIMHPTRVDPDYMWTVIAAAAKCQVDSFEICGDCHSWTGGLEGAIQFRDYPAATEQLDVSGIEENIRRLVETVRLAHESGRPVYYWHREVMVPRIVVETVPGLLDENGEFNLLGNAYHELIRSKVAEFFDRVPGMDGLVLTLTESNYSVIHNSGPERYPPALVIERVIATFAEALARRGKRFILRSFGSVAQDYEDILAGARRASAQFHFEVETKITPYDFSPFLPFNPFLRAQKPATLSAEYDSIGEFLGAGFLPAADPQRVIDSVNFARAQGVDRHAIRIDRIGHPVFASAQAVNLLAFERAILDPHTTAESVWSAWAEAHWPECAAEMTRLMRRGIEAVKKLHFIDGNVIFHAFPIQPELKWVKACGILSLFTPGADLSSHQGMWGILGDRRSPASRAAILQEKDEAIAIADECWGTLQTLRPRLSAEEFRVADEAWRNATVAARLIRAWCACVAAYFDDLAAGEADAPRLERAIAAARPVFAPFANVIVTRQPTGPSEHEYGDGNREPEDVASAYARPLWAHMSLLQEEYRAEAAERARWRARPGVVDYIVCGGLTDDHRVTRYMHASHSHANGRPSRVVGNRVFPNGFITCTLRGPASALILRIEGRADKSTGFVLRVDGRRIEAVYDADGAFEVALPAAATGEREIAVTLQKAGADYPWIHGVGLIRAD
ncbi:hypothetical protein K0B96_14900 [Horticoccus luteus]|uniref:Uncharacterized protein n=1 Tax=Horticoccus luteus TaxID=2862869 RepID=A0A8F9TT42_9BACT|nr:hypothetical protein [Horticoccus luteus]QYM78571.1 hypothetical protein K0B96_14900 [Horticoccus luteus]